MAELPELEPVLAPLLTRFWRFIPGLVGLGTAGAYSQIYGQQSAQGSSGGVIDSILHSIALAPAKVFGTLTGTSAQIHTATRSTISHWALAADNETAKWFDHLNVLTKATYQANLANVNAAAGAIERLSARERTDTHYRDGTPVKVRAQSAYDTATSTATGFHTFKATYARTHAAQVKLNVRYSHAIDVALPKQIAGVRTREEALSRDQAKLRERTTSLENGAIKTFEWIKAHPLGLAAGVFAGAVAVALTRLGFGFLRCRSWRSLARNLTCGMATVLEDLLFASITAFAALDLCDFANAAESVAEEFVPVLMELVDVENALVGCHGATLAPDLVYVAPTLPPQNLGLSLAA